MPLDPERLCERIAEGQYGLLSSRQALGAGLERHRIARRLRSGRWKWFAPGVLAIRGTPGGWHRSLMGTCLSLGPHALASHRCAAHLWQLDGWQTDVIEVSVPSKARRPGVLIHRLAMPCEDASRVANIPVTDPTRTILDLAAVANGYELERALDSALRKNLTHLSLLSERFEARARRGRNGTRQMRELLRVRDPNAQPHGSGLEVKFARFLRRHGFPVPIPQYVIHDPVGNFVARPDFAYVDEKVAIELQSYAFHHDRPQWEKDQRRYADLSAVGWQMFPVTDTQLTKAPGRLAERLDRVLSLRMAH